MVAKTKTPGPAGVDAASRVNGSQIPVRPGGLPTRQRRPGYIALLVVLVIGLGLAGGFLYTSAGSKATVLVVAADVPAGQVITRGDVTSASVAGDVKAIPAGQIGAVVGRRAVVELLAGTVLQPAMLGSGPKIAAGSVQVGLELPPGSLPAGGLLAGDSVQVWRLPAKNAADTAAAPVLVAQATVAQAVKDPSRAGGFLVTVTVPKTDAAAVVAAGGAGLATLVLVGPS